MAWISVGSSSPILLLQLQSAGLEQEKEKQVVVLTQSWKLDTPKQVLSKDKGGLDSKHHHIVLWIQAGKSGERSEEVHLASEQHTSRAGEQSWVLVMRDREDGHLSQMPWQQSQV